MTDENGKLHGLYDERGRKIQNLEKEIENQNDGTADDAILIAKLKNDKIKLKGHLKVTRGNNGILKTLIDNLRTENEEIEVQLQISNGKIANGANEIKSLKKTINELKKKNEEWMRKNDKLEEKIEHLKTKESKLVSDLKDCESSDADLLISQQETKDCNKNLEAHKAMNLHCDSERMTCDTEFQNEVKKNQNLRDRNSQLLKSMEKLTKENDESEIQIEDLKERFEELKNKQVKLVSDLKKCENTDADLVISRQETNKCNEELQLETNKTLHCQSENDSNLKLIFELKTNRTKLISDLKNCRITDGNLRISKQETKECHSRMELLQSILDECESGNQDAIITQKELDICRGQLNDDKSNWKLEKSKLKTRIKTFEITNSDLTTKNVNLKTANSRFRIRISNIESQNSMLEKKISECENDKDNCIPKSNSENDRQKNSKKIFVLSESKAMTIDFDG